MKTITSIKEAIIDILPSGVIEIIHGDIDDEHRNYHNMLEMYVSEGVLHVKGKRSVFINVEDSIKGGESLEYANTIIDFDNLKDYVKTHILTKYTETIVKKNWYGKKLYTYQAIINYHSFRSLKLMLLDKYWPTVTYDSSIFTIKELKKV